MKNRPATALILVQVAVTAILMGAYFAFWRGTPEPAEVATTVTGPAATVPLPQPADTVKQPARAPSTQIANIPPPSLPIYRGNAQRTGYYDSPPIRQSPALLWSHPVGQATDLILVDNTAYYGDAGVPFGISGIDINSHRQTSDWPTTGKPNTTYMNLAATASQLFAGDFGLFCLDRTSGAIKWTIRFKGSAPIRAPLMEDGLLYETDQAGLHAIDATTGTEKFMVPTTDGDPSPAAFNDGSIFFNSGYRGDLYAVDAVSGAIKWKANLGRSEGTSMSVPVATEGFVYKVTGGPSNPSAIVALDSESGKVIWRHQSSNVSLYPPVVIHGLLIYYESDYSSGDQQAGNALVALDAATGDVIWRTTGVFTNAPFTAAGGNIYVVQVFGDPRVFRSVPAAGITAVCAYDAATGSLLWSQSLPASYGRVTAPIPYRGILYVAAGELCALG